MAGIGGKCFPAAKCQAATRLSHLYSLHGVFNLSTWLTAIAGAAILLLACHLVSERTGHRIVHR